MFYKTLQRKRKSGECRCSGKVSIFIFTSDTHRATFKRQVIWKSSFPLLLSLAHSVIKHHVNAHSVYCIVLIQAKDRFTLILR